MLGGFVAAAVAIPMIGVLPPLVTLPIMVVFAMIVGAFWVGLAGFLRYARGVNETISSLLLTYIGIAVMNFFVEGVLRDVSNSQQAIDQAARRRLCSRQNSKHRRPLGLRSRHPALHRAHHHLERTTFAAARVTSEFPRCACARIARRAARRQQRSPDPAGLAGFFEVAAIQGRQRVTRRRLRLHKHSRRRSWRGNPSSSRRGDPLRRHRRRQRCINDAWACPTRRCSSPRA